ncbi:MAG: class I SAM-dependent methyltransferase [Deltaproteobacteria bacterium]|jgi:ubiquinone/menaquinone biosynthesis C-methylase UbiE|nr:class I SAM-dependent methyltransferase [Deltaproteobacteria bacterium]
MPRFLHAMSGTANRQRTTLVFAGSEWEEVRMDPSKEVSPAIRDSFPDMREVEDNSFDAVYTAHSLERLYPHQAMAALGNCRRVLKEDGYLVVICADIQEACAMASQDGLLETAYESPAGPVTPLDILYGFRPALAAGRLDLACHCGFTAKVLMSSLAQSGFGTVWASKNSKTFSMAALATKPKRSKAYLMELVRQHFG